MFYMSLPVTGDRISSPHVSQRITGDAGACDVTENSSPKVEQLVITPFDEGKLHTKLPLFAVPFFRVPTGQGKLEKVIEFHWPG